jgi:ABC-type multidrug transport system fused ATPase/permease subunit
MQVDLRSADSEKFSDPTAALERWLAGHARKTHEFASGSSRIVVNISMAVVIVIIIVIVIVVVVVVVAVVVVVVIIIIIIKNLRHPGRGPWKECNR